MKHYLLFIIMLIGAISCSTGKGGVTVPIATDEPTAKGGTAQALPKAIIYRTSGDFNLNVPISVSSDGKVLSYPAPSDLSINSTPVPLEGGYLLDRRGIGAKTVFTKYTYAEYMKLKTAPSLQELADAVIPGSMVTEIVELPMTAYEAASETAHINTLIRDGLPGCKVLYSLPRVKFDN